MSFPRRRQHFRAVLGFAVSLAVLTNGFSFANYRSHASVSLAKEPSRSKSSAPAPADSKSKSMDEGVKKRIGETYLNLPLSFEANRGQADSPIQFLSRGRGYGIFLTPQEAVLVLRSNAKTAAVKDKPFSAKGTAETLKMTLLNANRNPRMVGMDELPGKTNYFIGNDPQKWRTDVPNYERVRYEQVYRGIDMVYYGNQSQIEYDFIVSPGADPSLIRFACNGAKSLRIAPNGDLVIALKGGEVVQRKPIVYQEIDGRRQEIPGSYFLTGKRQVGFRLGQYDPNRTIIIDPVLTYSTFLGGSRDDTAWDIAVDGSGNAYITGETLSGNFPTASPLQGSHSGSTDFFDVFVSKINAAGSALVYSTYVGGTSNDSGNSISVDSAGSVYVSGSTWSTNFPTQNPFQSANGGLTDAIVFKLNAAGSSLVYSTYYGGSHHETGYGLDIDQSGNVYVAGYTISSNYATQNAVQATFGGGTCGSSPCDDAFLFKLNATGTTRIFSTFLGGNNQDRALAVAVDASGNAYVTGFTNSTNFPLSNALQTSKQGTASDAFVTAYTSTGSYIYSTYLGGSGADEGFGIAVDNSGNAYLTGDTRSTNFPTVNAFQTTLRGLQDAFVTKISSTGAALVYSTYLGGTHAGDEVEGGWDIVVDADGNAYITGNADSPDFPTVNPVQNGNQFLPDAFVTKLNAAGTSLIYSLVIGGSDLDFAKGIALDSLNNAYVAGHTLSLNFPVANALQPINAGGNFSFSPEDAFVLKITDVDGLDISGQVADAGGNPIPFVKVSLTGSARQDDFTDANGNYAFLNLNPGGSFTLTPSRTNFTFSPTSQTVNNLSQDQTVNFTGSVNQIVLDGKIKDANGAGVSGVTVSLSGSQTASVLTTTSGTYTFSNLNAGGSYTITPSRNSDVFTPTSKTYNNLGSNQTFDFTLVYAISGQVTDSVGNPASGVTLSLSGAQTGSTQTDVTGNYSFTNLPAGVTYTVTPSRPDYTFTYTFTPASQTFSNLSANQTANFSFTTASNLTIFPVADAYVQDGTAAGTNFGSATPMLLRSSNTTGQKRDVYLKFDLSSVSKVITSVKLRFTAALSAGNGISTAAYSVADTTWLEKDPGGINWNNKPARGATALATVSVATTTFATYELNVTSYVVSEKAAGRNLISLALHNPSNSTDHINMNSREAATNKPQLLITTSDNGNAAPTVSITAPVNGAPPFTAGSNITINASAADSDGTVSQVDFYAGTAKIDTDATAPYSIVWPAVEAGNYSLRAVATDNNGLATTSSTVNIAVNLANNLPQVSLTAPPAGLTIPAGGSIVLTANASDIDGSITKVDFFTGATLIGTDTTSPYSFAWSNIPAGAHTLTAVATDNSNATATSSPVALTAIWRTGLSPIMDAYVRDGASASTNFGTAAELQVQASATAGSNRETHLKFDITSVSAITGAKLRLYGALIDTSGTNIPAAVYPTTPTNWIESGNGSITWNNKPVAGASLATATITDNVARWYEWDLTTYIQQEKSANRNTISLAIKSTANSSPYITFNSKEAGINQPQLLITSTATRNILFVIGASTPNTSEAALKTRMENLGFTVTVKQAGSNQNSAVNTADAFGKAAVVISSTVTPANVGTKFRNVVVPVLLWDADLLDDQAMTGTASSEFGTTAAQTQITILDAAHPLAAGLTGNVSVVTSSSVSWGKPNANAAKVASQFGDATKITIFGYDTSAVMPGAGAPGVPAPARRVGFFLTDTNGVNLSDPQGKALFDAAIKWLTATIVTPVISTVSPTFGTIGTAVTITGYNFGDTQGTVTFNGVSASPTSWTSSSIVTPVPAGATSGPVLVVVSGLASNGIAFEVEVPPVDTDSDGLPDAWEMQYFGNLNQGANDNPDGDALNNLQEYLQGRNPTVGTVEDSGGGVNLRLYTPLIPTSP